MFNEVPNLRPVLLLREAFAEHEEITNGCLPRITSRLYIKKDDLVIGRYWIPCGYPELYKELEKDCILQEAQLINSFKQYNYVADLGNYYQDLQDLTAKTYTDLGSLPDNTSFVLKGATSSKKNNWSTHMFAKSRSEAAEVYWRLKQDTLVGDQTIYIREFLPFVKLIDGIGNMPVTKEFRFFCAFGKVLAGGFYWSNYIDDVPTIPNVAEVPMEFLSTVLERIGKNTNAVVVDVGQLQDGSWKVVELNDLQFSGLSCVNPVELYSNLSKLFYTDK